MPNPSHPMPLIPDSTARWIAPVSFCFNFGAQIYGMRSRPNIKQVHENNLSIFSPHPFFIAAFFAAQLLLQLVWIGQLWAVTRRNRAWKHQVISNELERIENNGMTAFVPFLALFNVCMGVWTYFWTGTHLQTANAFTLINTAAQIYYMLALLPQPLNLSSPPSYLTHALCKALAGLGVLDTLHNTSVAYPTFRHTPATTVVRVVTGTAFLAASSTSDWIFGGCLVYDLLALAAGQYGSWKWTLYVFAAICGITVLARNTRRPPYTRRETGLDYESLEQGDYD